MVNRYLQRTYTAKKIVYTDSFADNQGNIVAASYYNMPEMPLELLVTIAFEKVDARPDDLVGRGKTNMSLQHVGLPAGMIDECLKGWQSSLDKLESNVK